MKRRAGVAILAVGFFLAAEAGSAADRAVARGGARSGGGGRSGWHGGGGGGGGRSARGPVTGAQARHPRAGTGSAYRHGSYYGHGGGYGHKGYYGGKGYGYGRGYYPYRPYYGYGYGGGYWPYYGGYPYYGYGWGPSLSIGFNYVADSGYGGYPAHGGGYSGGYDEGREPYARDERTRDDVETGDVVLDVQPGDASVYVDDQFRGIGRDVRHLRLRAGRHRIEVVRPGYGTHYDEIVVEAGRDAAVDVRLDRR